MTKPPDSIDKIVTRYFAAVTLTPFTYKKKKYEPKQIKVSPSIFYKGMTCVANCGGCCARFSLDYLPREAETNPKIKAMTKSRMVPFSTTDSWNQILIYSDVQDDIDGHYCRNLQMDDGRCGIHGHHPFSCDFELLRTFHFEDVNTPDRLSHQPFGRGWAMLRIDGKRGALCEWYDKPSDPQQIEDVSRKLERLQEWATHFGIRTTLPTIIDWVRRGPHPRPLITGPKQEGGFGLV